MEQYLICVFIHELPSGVDFFCLSKKERKKEKRVNPCYTSLLFFFYEARNINHLELASFHLLTNKFKCIILDLMCSVKHE